MPSWARPPGRHLFHCLGVAALLLTAPARADSPLPPPTDHTVQSPNGRCTARASLREGRVIVVPAGDGTGWSVPGWHRQLLASDDCRSLGVGYDGLNLLRRPDRLPGTPIMRFFHPDGPGRVVRLHQLYPDLTVMPATVSHWLPYRATHWNGQDWIMDTVDGRRLRFPARGGD